ncbi:hypothetical protein HK405_005925 [Cladochytrium tenue]|nr:hypothetical protein HK405_005925 [Cladochytrium tenue]
MNPATHQPPAGPSDSEISLVELHAFRSNATVSVVEGSFDDKARRETNSGFANYFALFRNANALDVVLYVAGFLGAALVGVFQPLFTIYLGDILDADAEYTATGSIDELYSAVVHSVLMTVYLGVGAFVGGYFASSFLNWAGARVAGRIRLEYLAALLRQDAAWYDTTTVGAHIARLSADVNTIQTGISFKTGVVVQSLASLICGFIVAFTKGPKLAGVITATLPIIAGSAFFMTAVVEKRAGAAAALQSEASGVAQEVLSAIKTVLSFNGHDREVDRYGAHLKKAEEEGVRSALATGLGSGTMIGSLFGMFALSFYYGAVLVNHGMTAGEVLNTFFALLTGAMALTSLSPNLSAMANAAAASTEIMKTIKRRSLIDASSKQGLKPESVQGVIEFRNVYFHYPQRPEVPVLRDFCLRIEPGQTIGLVGLSGSGKSTIINLLLRFYDPVSGSITLDGRDLRSLNVSWLRQQIGVVRQEPVLFDMTVRENLLLGLRDDMATLDDNRDPEVESKLKAACRLANAWDFVAGLPQGLDTSVGEVGGRMSGGQKQRIAIARAILRNPSILLLDEATSALDTTSERTVQKALDTVAINRTSVIVAHRLSSVMNADTILVLESGQIVESGTHENLMNIDGGIYASLAATQALHPTAPPVSEDVLLDKRSEIEVVTDTIRVRDQDGIAATVASHSGSQRSTKENLKSPQTASRKIPLRRILKLSVDEVYFYIFGCLAAVADATVFPFLGLIFSSTLVVLEESDDSARIRDITFWCLMFVALGVASFLCQTASKTLFGIAGERLATRIRTKTFANLLRQEPAYFDEEGSSSAALSVRLAEDAKLVQELVGRTLFTMIQALTVLTCNILSGAGEKIQKLYEESAVVATEGVRHILTVMSLTKEQVFHEKYKKSVQHPLAISIKGSFAGALGYGVSQSVIFFTFGICFYVGVELVRKGMMDVNAVLKVIFEVIFTAISLGQAASEAPDIARAKLAAVAVFDILDRNSSIDPASMDGHSVPFVSGKVEFKDVFFRYPARPERIILDGLTFLANPGKTIAFVGKSGCGKSTIVGLIQRMYDTQKGLVAVDDVSTKSWNVASLRRHISVVGQEPVLFNVSIADNIAYGAKIGQSSMDEIVAAARLANIHDFVASLPQGYESVVGVKGSQLSGGQRQRVAIARALIGNPEVLLLDEATSALDSESEKLVQQAIDNASAGRTTFVIAHRLATVRGADWIYVLDGGSIVESGTYADLLQQGGEFASLVAAQDLEAATSS